MFVFSGILTLLQNEYSSPRLCRKRRRWIAYSVLAFIIPFTSSMFSNILRCMNTLFDINVNRRRFYIFIASNKFPWAKLGRRLWNMIPSL